MRTPHVLTLAAAAVAFSVVAPAHADAPPDGLAALHLTKRAPKLVADAFTFERTEDQRAFFGKVSPEWIVHTAVDAAAGARVCPSTWNVRACVSLDPKDTKQRVSREQLARKDWFAFPKYGWAMGWGTTLTYGDDVARGVDTSYFGTIASIKVLKKNTPGVILGTTAAAQALNSFDGDDLKTSVRFLALDGTLYLLQPSQLAAGAPQAAEWPDAPQHTLYIDTDEEFGKLDGAPNARPWEPPPKSLVDALHTARDGLKACNVRAWAPGVAQMRAIDASSLPASVRQSRTEAVVERTSFRAIAACAAPFATYAKAIEKINDAKRTNRAALLAENKARFGK